MKFYLSFCNRMLMDYLYPLSNNEGTYKKTSESIQTLSQLEIIRLNKCTLRQTISLSKI